VKFSFIPGYDEAVEAEESIRLASFFEVPRTLLGFDVRPLTVRDVMLLDFAKSPFMHGGAVTPVDIAIALWILSVDRTQGKSRRRFVRRCRSVRYGEAVAAIGAYLEDELLDSPGGGGGKEARPQSWVADIVHLFASTYGWTEPQILDLPMARANQYIRAIRASKDSQALFINPRSDRVKGDWLKTQQPEVRQ